MIIKPCSPMGGTRLGRPLHATAIGGIAALAALIVAGCGSSGSSSSPTNTGAANPTGGAAAPAKPGGTITIGLPAGAIDHLEPTLWYYATTWEIAYATCTPLMTFADSSGAAGVKAIPGVGQQPTVSADGRTYKFTLKPGVTFADGTPITGEAIKYTFDRMLSPGLASPATSFFGDIVGAPAVIAGKAKTLTGITATASTVTFTLDHPVASFLYRLTLPFSCPVPIGTPMKPIENGSALLSGPYVVKSYTPQRSIVLARNPHWNTAELGDRQTANQISIQIGVDANQAGPLIRAGQLATYGAPLGPTDALQALSDATLKGQVFVDPLPGITYLWLNNTVPPFNNFKVRQAVNYAIDRQAIVRVWGGPSEGKPADQVLPPTMPGWIKANIYPDSGNPAQAQALMKASGVHTPVSVTLRTLSDQPGYAQIAQVIQAELAPIGIKVGIVTAPDAVNGAVVSAPKNHVPMGINTWTQDYPYPDDFMGPLLNGQNITATGNNNYASFNVPAINNQIAALEAMGSPSQWNQLDAKIIRDYAPWAPLLNPTRVTLFAKATCGAIFHPVYLIDFAKLGRCT
ncbi:MAG: ABC transporter substrate-binding protein [Solirubrobacteraceae bacterium]